MRGSAARGWSFAGVIVQILLLDIIFSLDSVITAVGMVEDLAVMVLAVVLAVGVMLVSAGTISDFVERHPTVKMLALSFLLLIGVAEGFDQHIPKGYIYFAMGFSIFVEMINLRIRGKSKPVHLRQPSTRSNDVGAMGLTRIGAESLLECRGAASAAMSRTVQFPPAMLRAPRSRLRCSALLGRCIAGLSLDTCAIVTWATHGGGVIALAAIVVAVLAYRARAWLRLAAAGVAVVAGLTCAKDCLNIGARGTRQRSTTSRPTSRTADILRGGRAEGGCTNRLDRPPQLAELQRQGYGEPITLQTKPDQAFDRALAVAQSQAWEIVTADKSSGRIEATHTTRWFGFVDDVVVRLTPWGSAAYRRAAGIARSATPGATPTAFVGF